MSNRDYRKNSMKSFKPYVVGKPIEEVRRELGIEGPIAKLASNENPLGASPKAIEAVKEHLDQIHLYPDDNHYAFKKALSARFGIKMEQLYCASGSSEVIDVICSTFIEPGAGDEILSSERSFAMYQIGAIKAGGKFVGAPMKDKYYYDLEAIANSVTEKTKVIFLANPNNPTGTWFSASEFDKFMARVPEDVLVVYDIAYHEFTTREDLPDPRKYFDAGRDIIVLRTLSKAYGLAGLRVGFAYGREDLISHLSLGRTPFNVNSLAQAAAIAALSDDEFVKKSGEFTVRELEYIIDGLKGLDVVVPPTQANFVLVDTKKEAPWLFMELQKRGIIVRPLHGYDYPNAIRVNVGLREENERFLAAMRELLK